MRSRKPPIDIHYSIFVHFGKSKQKIFLQQILKFSLKKIDIKVGDILSKKQINSRRYLLDNTILASTKYMYYSSNSFTSIKKS